MATLVLSGLGAAAGGSIGGGVLGLSSVVIGRAVGATVGRVIDEAILGSGSRAVETGKVDRFRLTGAGEGVAIPRVHGRMRVAGQVIWASRFMETTTTSGGSGKGGRSGPRVTEYGYSVSLAIALCEGEIARVGRIWIDGKEAERDTLDLRVYPGSETQLPDPKIEAVEGVAPAFRGTAYVVIEDLDLAPFGNRVPQFSFEVVRTEQAAAEPSELSRLVRAVAMIPGTGEYALATTPVHYEAEPGVATSANVHTPLGGTDFAASVEVLTDELPLCRSTSLVVSWFGDDLRCGMCRLKPKVEQTETDGTGMPWSVSGLTRDAAETVAREAGRVVYGGTPADRSVIEAIGALRTAGQAVMFYPFILMEQLDGNALPDPYSGGTGQAALPWRGRITLSAAPGQAGSPDGTAAAEAEVAAFFGSAGAGDFEVSAEGVRYVGGAEWGYRRFILHYAHLCAAAGGVDAFCIGSEMRGLTQIRGFDWSYPAVVELQRLAADVRSILGPQTKIGYAADWSEYFGHQPQDGSGDAVFHLDPLWADPEIDFVGIDNYMPLADWRDGETHADAGAGSGYDLGYLKGNVAGGEGFDWYYSSAAARDAQIRAPITDGATLLVERAAEAMLPAGPFAEDLDGWRGRTVTFAGTVTFPEVPEDGVLFEHGGGAAGLWIGVVGEGEVFRLRAGAVPAGAGTAVLELPADALPFDGNAHRLTWEVRPGAPGQVRLWVDGALAGSAGTGGAALAGGVWSDGSVGAWVQGPGGAWPGGAAGDLAVAAGPVEEVAPGEPWIYRYKDLRSWWSLPHHDRIAGARRAERTAWEPRSKPIWFTEFGCPAVDKGANQPNVFLDPKSSESALPHYSTGRRDDFMQLQYVRAVTEYWSDPANNPVSPLYGGAMVALDRAHVWAWDARPYPYFPARAETWSDGDNYARGHWITGRTGSRSLASVVREICAASGVPEVDTLGLYGIVRGYVVNEVSGARNALQPLLLAHGVDAIEREGQLRFRSRSARTDAVLEPGGLAVTPERESDLEAIRGAAAEIADRVRITHPGADGDFETRTAEAVFPGSAGLSVAESELALALTRAEATALAERWLAESRIGRDRQRFALPPSRLALGAGDVVELEGGRFRIDRVEQGALQLIEAQRVEPEVYRPGPGVDEAASVARFAPPVPVLDVFLDLPLLRGDEVPHAPHVAATARPWPGGAAVYDSPTRAGYRLNTVLPVAARIGVTEAPLAAAPPGLLDNGAGLPVRMISGTLESVEFAQLLAGANAVAIGSGTDDLWEVLQFAEAELIGAGRYLLSGRLRGQAGTDAVVPAVWPAGSRLVVLDAALRQIDLAAANRGLAHSYRVGPAARSYDDPSFVERQRAFAGVGLRPYAPVHLGWEADGTGGGVARWIRRTRIDGDSWEGFDVPLGEASERYLVRVLVAGAIRREVFVTAPSWVYTASERAADGAAGAFKLAVAQVSDRFGPGPFRSRSVGA